MIHSLMFSWLLIFFKQTVLEFIFIYYAMGKYGILVFWQHINNIVKFWTYILFWYNGFVILVASSVYNVFSYLQGYFVLLSWMPVYFKTVSVTPLRFSDLELHSIMYNACALCCKTGRSIGGLGNRSKHVGFVQPRNTSIFLNFTNH